MTTTHPDIQQAQAALQRAVEALLADGADIITIEAERARGGKAGYTAEIHIFPGDGVPDHLAAQATARPIDYGDGRSDTEYSVDFHGARVHWLEAFWPQLAPPITDHSGATAAP